MERSSCYLTMRDGVRLAVDVWLPLGVAPDRSRPTILHQTRYHRRTGWRAPARWIGLDRLTDIHHDTRQRFLGAGFAWVDVDARGSGASFGSRPCPWWQDEIRDGAEVVDWIVRQPWSNGRVGATGISYSGTTAEFLLTNRHPAVRAIATRFSLFDVYSDVAFPGGLHLDWFTRTWAACNEHLDQNAAHRVFGTIVGMNLGALADLDGRLRVLSRVGIGRAVAGVLGALSTGVACVDGDPGLDRNAALRDHVANFNVHQGARGVTYRDDQGIHPLVPEESIDVFSPHRYLDDLKASGAAVLSVSGWLDGAYIHSAIKRHLSLDGAHRLLLGPWEHGGRQDISPFNDHHRTRFDHTAELIRFFDYHLRDADNGYGDVAPVRYFTLGEERWKETDTWPPPGGRPLTWYLTSGRALSQKQPETAGIDTYGVDERATSGPRSRWRSLLGLLAPVGYSDRRREDERLLCYTSAALPRDLEVTGHPRIRLHLSANAADCAVFVYLEDVFPGGRVQYVTEGQLRALHRRLADDRAPYRSPAGYRSFEKRDARELIPGEPAELIVDLLPISYRFSRGHHLRVAIAGSDADHFVRLPGSLPILTVHSGGSLASCLELPVVQR